MEGSFNVDTEFQQMDLGDDLDIMEEPDLGVPPEKISQSNLVEIYLFSKEESRKETEIREIQSFLDKARMHYTPYELYVLIDSLSYDMTMFFRKLNVYCSPEDIKMVYKNVIFYDEVQEIEGYIAEAEEDIELSTPQDMQIGDDLIEEETIFPPQFVEHTKKPEFPDELGLGFGFEDDEATEEPSSDVRPQQQKRFRNEGEEDVQNDNNIVDDRDLKKQGIPINTGLFQGGNKKNNPPRYSFNWFLARIVTDSWGDWCEGLYNVGNVYPKDPWYTKFMKSYAWKPVRAGIVVVMLAYTSSLLYDSVQFLYSNERAVGELIGSDYYWYLKAATTIFVAFNAGKKIYNWTISSYKRWLASSSDAEDKCPEIQNGKLMPLSQKGGNGNEIPPYLENKFKGYQYKEIINGVKSLFRANRDWNSFVESGNGVSMMQHAKLIRLLGRDFQKQVMEDNPEFFAKLCGLDEKLTNQYARRMRNLGHPLTPFDADKLKYKPTELFPFNKMKKTLRDIYKHLHTFANSGKTANDHRVSDKVNEISEKMAVDAASLLRDPTNTTATEGLINSTLEAKNYSNNSPDCQEYQHGRNELCNILDNKTSEAKSLLEDVKNYNDACLISNQSYVPSPGQAFEPPKCPIPEDMNRTATKLMKESSIGPDKVDTPISHPFKAAWEWFAIINNAIIGLHRFQNVVVMMDCVIQRMFGGKVFGVDVPSLPDGAKIPVLTIPMGLTYLAIDKIYKEWLLNKINQTSPEQAESYARAEIMGQVNKQIKKDLPELVNEGTENMLKSLKETLKNTYTIQVIDFMNRCEGKLHLVEIDTLHAKLKDKNNPPKDPYKLNKQISSMIKKYGDIVKEYYDTYVLSQEARDDLKRFKKPSDKDDKDKDDKDKDDEGKDDKGKEEMYPSDDDDDQPPQPPSSSNRRRQRGRQTRQPQHQRRKSSSGQKRGRQQSQPIPQQRLRNPALKHQCAANTASGKLCKNMITGECDFCPTHDPNRKGKRTRKTKGGARKRSRSRSRKRTRTRKRKTSRKKSRTQNRSRSRSRSSKKKRSPRKRSKSPKSSLSNTFSQTRNLVLGIAKSDRPLPKKSIQVKKDPFTNPLKSEDLYQKVRETRIRSRSRSPSPRRISPVLSDNEDKPQSLFSLFDKN